MSTEVNTKLMERASEMIDYWTDKLPAQLIEHDLERNDLEALAQHVAQAEALAGQEEFKANDCA